MPNRMNFRKSSKGGGVVFNPKNDVADFGNFKQGFLIMKLIQKSNFRVQGMFFQQVYRDTSEWSLSLEIMCTHFILSGPCTTMNIFDCIHYKKFAT